MLMHINMHPYHPCRCRLHNDEKNINLKEASYDIISYNCAIVCCNITLVIELTQPSTAVLVHRTIAPFLNEAL